jgi:hypothetical protein
VPSAGLDTPITGTPVGEQVDGSFLRLSLAWDGASFAALYSTYPDAGPSVRAARIGGDGAPVGGVVAISDGEVRWGESTVVSPQLNRFLSCYGADIPWPLQATQLRIRRMDVQP